MAAGRIILLTKAALVLGLAVAAAACSEKKVVSCPEGRTACGQACVELLRDQQNCGACRNVCEAGSYCSEGVCVLLCEEEGLTACYSGATPACVSLDTDEANCGACGVRCRDDHVCRESACRCPSGRPLCGGYCTSLATDENCGTCGATCPFGSSCVREKCENCEWGKELVAEAAPFPERGSLAPADLDGDGRSDLLWMGEGLQYSLRGDARFGEPKWILRDGSRVAATAPGDLDGDGRTDILVATLEKIIGFRNNLPHGFDRLFDVDVELARAVALVDLDGDGTVEVLYSSQGLYRLALSTLQSEQLESQFPHSMLPFDADFDGDVDVLGYDSTKVVFLENRGAGALVRHDWPLRFLYRHAFGDFDGDAFVDVAGYSGGVVEIAYGSPAGFSEPVEVSGTGAYPAIEDVDGDSVPELLIKDRNRLAIFRRGADGRPVRAEEWILPSFYYLRLADFEGDGTLDLVGEASVFQNRPKGPSTKKLLFDGNVGALVGGDFDGDGARELAVAIRSTSGIRVELFEGDSRGSLRSTEVIRSTVTEAGRLELRVVRLRIGGDELLLCADDQPYGLFREDGEWTERLLAQGTCPFPADMDGDGIDDLVSSEGIRLGVGDGSFGESLRPETWGAVQGVADLDGDGLGDVFGGKQILLNQGGGRFALGGTSELGLQAAARFGDHESMQLVGYRCWQLEVLSWSALSQQYQQEQRFSYESSTGSFAIGDLDGDGRDDLFHNRDGGKSYIQLGHGGLLSGPAVQAWGVNRAPLLVDLDGDSKAELFSIGRQGELVMTRLQPCEQ